MMSEGVPLALVAGLVIGFLIGIWIGFAVWHSDNDL